MSNYILPIEWEPSGGIILEAAAESAVKSNNNLLVIAGPGSGKTELLAQKTDYLFQTNFCSTPRMILAISFKKDAAENLKDRISKRYGDEYANRFSSLTYDAFAKKLLDQFRNSLPQKHVPHIDYLVEDDAVISDVFDQHIPGFASWRKGAKNQKIDELLFSNPNREIWNTLLKGDKGNPSCLTFKMITILATSLINKNPIIREALQKTYSHIFLDEFQDTTDLQYNLVKACFLNGESLITAVGDSKQRIMEWAGARKTIFNDFQQEFHSDKVSLIMNHRSAPRLVDLQKKMYDSLGEKELKAVHSEKWDSDEGEIKLFNSTDEKEEARKLVNDIDKKIQNGVSADNICILVKQTVERYSSEIITLLKERNIRARIENRYQDLLKQSVVSLILEIFKVSLKIQNVTDWEDLENFWIRKLGIEEGSSKHSFDSMQKDLKKMIDYCRKQLECDLNEESFKNFVLEIVKLINKESICQIYPEYEQGIYLEQVLNEFVNLFWKEYVNSSDFKNAIENFQGDNTIPIMTIHKSKGLEYEAVYFVGLEDSAFWNFKNQPDADRSAFFVAISRAKKYLAFSYCSNRSSLKNVYNPSGAQKNTNINEFFELLMVPGVATIES